MTTVMRHACNQLTRTAAATVEWPQDDSYRGHVDAQWLRVLAAWVAAVEDHPLVSAWRYFYVIAPPAVTPALSVLP
jgi:hypothetical protein